MLILITRFLKGLTGKKLPPWPPKEPIKEVSSEDLMRMYAKGRTEAFEVLLERHERGVYNFVLRSCGDPTRAEDLTQDIFLKVVRSAPRYKETAKFTTWLYTIARNRCIDDARSHGRKPTVSLNRSVSGDSDDGDGRTFLDRLTDKDAHAGDADVSRQEFRAHLQRALEALPDEQREVFLMREVSGMKFREIADVVGVSENTIKSRMRYALETLRGHLEEFRGHSFDADEARQVGGSR